MESENDNQGAVEVNGNVLFKVTPLSKYLALILFIILPFLGGYIGYTFAPEKVVEVEKVIVQEKNTSSVVMLAPSIQAQDVSGAFEEQMFLLMQEPVVKTSENKDITLKLLFSRPGGKESNHIGIFSYEEYLYFYDNSIFTLVPNGDPGTFEVVSLPLSFDIYSKDKNNVYCGISILQNADSTSFEENPEWFANMITEKGVVRDKNHTYDELCRIVQ